MSKKTSRKKRLGDLFAGLDVQCADQVRDLQVCGLTADSRDVTPGMLFVAVQGMTVDGHAFISDAVKKGCAAVLVDQHFNEPCSVPTIRTDDTMGILGFAAAAFYDFPCRQMKMIGVTGTNGKTTCTYLLEDMIKAMGGSPGVIGTVSVRFAGQETPAAFTTPQPVELQQILRQMADSGVSHVAMEVSSHALAQQRVNGVWFDVALFTNLSRDHLDFHSSMESYYSQKEKLFSSHLKENGRGVVVLEGAGQQQEKESWSDNVTRLLAAGSHPFYTCGLERGLIQARNFKSDLHGIRADIVTATDRSVLQSPMVGEFNLKNVLGVVGCGEALGRDLNGMCQALGRIAGAPGRLERVSPDNMEADSQMPSVFVDYAHTPDALENVLQTLRELQPSRLIVVFGCGGDRDRGKRPLMGEVAARIADVIFVTSDNPRNESPQKILDEIELGIKEIPLRRIRGEVLMQSRGEKGYDVIEKRAEAIRIAIACARKGDVVLISGKGHECYQIVGSQKLFFDDRQQAAEDLKKALGSKGTVERIHSEAKNAFITPQARLVAFAV